MEKKPTLKIKIYKGEVHCCPILHKFLTSQFVWIKYRNNIKAQNSNVKIYAVDLCDFSWKSSPEGVEFWANLNTKFKTFRDNETAQ